MVKKKKAKRERTEEVITSIAQEGWETDLDPETGVMTITIQTARKGRPSKSGKMQLLASSRGWKKIGDISFSFNVGRKVG